MSVPRQTIVPAAEGPIDVWEAGTPHPDRPAIVLLHGIQGTRAVWTPVMSHLKERWHVVAPNLRGRGASLSPNNPDCYQMSDFAADLAAVLDSIEGPVVLVGWSMGSLVALDYLRGARTERLDGLVLVSGTACVDAPGLTRAIWFNGDTPDALARDARARAVRLGLADTATDIAVAGSWISAAQADYRDVLSDIDLPVLVLHGTEDPECPPDHGEALAKGIPDARLFLWSGAGHVPMAERPGQFANTLADFLQSLAAAAN